ADDQLRSLAERAELAFHAIDGLLRDRLLEADPFRLRLALEGCRDGLAVLLRAEEFARTFEQFLRRPRVGPFLLRPEDALFEALHHRGDRLIPFLRRLHVGLGDDVEGLVEL